MPDTLHFYYVRSILGRWCPETSSTHPNDQTRDGKPLNRKGHPPRFVDHHVLTEAEAALSLTTLQRRYPCTLTKPPVADTYLGNPSRPRAGEQIGAGFFVFRRGTTTGRIRPAKMWPFEHPTRAAAEAEAQRLSARFPGQTFVVVEQVASAYTDPPAEDAVVTAEVAA